LKRLLLFLFAVFILYNSWPFIERQLEETNLHSITDNIKDKLDEVKESPELSAFITNLNKEISYLVGQLNNSLKQLTDDPQQQGPEYVEKPDLTTPVQQIFSVYNIEIGTLKEEVEQKVGADRRSSYNEYGVKWYTYHENYQNFIMVAYNEANEVVGLYTNQDLITSTKEITLRSPKKVVREQLGDPLTRIRKGLTFYQFPEDRDYDMFLLGNSYVTIFYDQHQDNTVTSIQIISEELEQKKDGLYTEASQQLEEGFAYQLFDLTNATRVNHGLQILTWDEHVKETARKHSTDMAESNYFDHINLEGQTPFDRMLEDDIIFTLAGENIASGQFSSIFAHEGLMNSLGHRKIILQPDFEFLGVGVAFNPTSQPYYTENFYTD
jgi:uncharacterized protein YkwD